MEKLSLKNRYSRLNVPRKIRQHAAIPACRVLFTRRGCRVRIAAMPPTNAYTAQTNASRSAKEPNTSTETSILHLAQTRTLHGAGLRRARCCARSASRIRFVFGGAFCLHTLSHKGAITRPAFYQRLRTICKSIRQGISAHVADGKLLPLSFQHKIDPAGRTADAAGLDGAPHANPLSALSTVQRLQFRDGVVIGLAFPVAQPRQGGQ